MRKSSIMPARAHSRPSLLRPLLPYSLISFVLGLAGCPPSSSSASPDATTTATTTTEPAKANGVCARVGQTCEVSPGKLGTCVQKDDCPGAGPCFVCQSQH